MSEATADDVPTLVAILQAAFEEYRGRLIPPSGAHQQTLEELQQRLKTARAVLVTIDSTPVACVLYEVKPDLIYLSRLGVLPAQRRRGIGCALVQYVETRAAALHRPRVRLGVRIALPHLHAWYESMGYRTVEYHAHEGFDQPTYILMDKYL